MGSYLNLALEQLKSFEGSIPWMYLDTVGKVTVGIGSMLPDAKAAATLPFSIDGRAATPDEIAADFLRVTELGKGRLAPFYRKSGGLRLDDHTIDAKLTDVLQGFEGYLRNHVKNFESLPDAAKVAPTILGPAGSSTSSPI